MNEGLDRTGNILRFRRAAVRQQITGTGDAEVFLECGGRSRRLHARPDTKTLGKLRGKKAGAAAPAIPSGSGGGRSLKALLLRTRGLSACLRRASRRSRLGNQTLRLAFTALPEAPQHGQQFEWCWN